MNGTGEGKNVTAAALEHLENQADLLRGEVGNVTGRLSWVSLPTEDSPKECETGERNPEQQRSSIVEQINRIINKTDESTRLLKKIQERIEI